MRGSRIDLLSRDLADLLASTTDEEKRSICLAVCKRAAERTELTMPAVQGALRLLEHGRFDDKSLVPSLERLVEDLDAEYFDAMDRYEAGEDSEEHYKALFARARAANAVLFAFIEEPLYAAAESIYEAGAAMGNAEVRKAINETLHLAAN